MGAAAGLIGSTIEGGGEALSAMLKGDDAGYEKATKEARNDVNVRFAVKSLAVAREEFAKSIQANKDAPGTVTDASRRDRSTREQPGSVRLRCLRVGWRLDLILLVVPTRSAERGHHN